MGTKGGEATGPSSVKKPRAIFRSDPGPVLFSLSHVPVAFEGFPSLGTLVMPLPELCFLQLVVGVAQSNLPQDLSRVLPGYCRRALRFH